MGDNIFARFPFDLGNDWITDSSKRIGNIGNPACKATISIGKKFQAIRATIVGHETGVVFAEAGNGKAAKLLPGLGVPVQEFRGQVTGKKLFSIGVECNLINMF